MSSEHFHPELTALVAAWRGSIHLSGIPDDLQRRALSLERFETYLFERVLPGVWLPPRIDEPVPAPPTPEVALSEPDDMDSIRKMLHDQPTWMTYGPDRLLQLLQWSMLLYGTRVDEGDVPALSALYRRAVEITDAEHRGLMLLELTRLVERYRVSPPVYLPVLVHEPDENAASTATIDFVSVSPFEGASEPYAFREIDALMRQRSLECPGAVFGAIVCMGDDRFRPWIERWKPMLQQDDIAAAARTQTVFLADGAVRFWLEWAEALVSKHDPESERTFGNVASALWRLPHVERTGQVMDAQRVMPAFDIDKPVRHLKVWTKQDYAQSIAERLYALEALERAPKLFSEVLRQWGLTPKAKPEDQYLPDQSQSH